MSVRRQSSRLLARQNNQPSKLDTHPAEEQAFAEMSRPSSVNLVSNENPAEEERSTKMSYRSKTSKASQVRRLRLKAELDAAEQLAKIANERALQQETIANERALQQETLVKKRLELELASIEDLNITDDSISHVGSDAVVPPLSHIPPTTSLAKVTQWIADADKREEISQCNIGYGQKKCTSVENINNQGMADLAQAIVQAVHSAGRPDRDMHNLVVRQTVGKELPFFSGAAEEWPCFIGEFKRSTMVCGFSDVENMHRLQKALKGKAREVVQVMLNIPEHVDNVISLLERRFGNPEHIIEHLIAKLKAMRPPKEEDTSSIIEFGDALQSLVLTVKMLDYDGYMQNPQLVKELLQKLPASLRLKWGENIVAMDKRKVTLEDFSVWMSKIVEAANAIKVFNPFKHHGDNRSVFQRNNRQHRESVLCTTQNNSRNTKKEKYCQFCKNKEHDLEMCEEFRKLEIEERWKWVRDNRTCFSCLCIGHQLRQCHKKKSCGQADCKRPHHRLLHQTKEIARGSLTEEVNTTSEELLTHSEERAKKKVLLRIVPVTLSGPTGAVKTYALFDEASTVTLLDAAVGEEIGATGPVARLRMRWTNSLTCEDNESRNVTIHIQGDGGEIHEMSNVRTIKNLSLPVQSVNMKVLKNNWEHLEMIRVNSMDNARPTILIGQDNIDLIIAREVVEMYKNAPVASRTKLGWVIHGNVTQFSGRIDEEFSLHIRHDEDRDVLHEMVKRHFETENFGVKVRQEQLRSKQDVRAQDIMDATTKCIPVQDRWETGLLWKEDAIQLPKSKHSAMKRLTSMERKMDRDITFSQAYCDKVDEFVGKGYARKLSYDEALVEEGKTWYLPHFAVVNPNKPGKIRFVFDAASKVNGTSLNDALLKGPDLLNSLTGIILKFRQRQIAFGADIKEMFPQIKIIQKDRTAQRFLWRGNRRDIYPEVYEMTSMIFGAVCSPSSAQYVKNRNAKEYESLNPAAVDAIISKHYMDDYLDSVDTVEEAKNLIADVIHIHKQGGFVICNWISNSTEILEAIAPELRATTQIDLGKNVNVEPSSDRVLGLWWNTNEDVFHFKLKLQKICENIVNGRRIPTKREILKIIMSIFDPLGFVAHFTIYGKILLQDIWRSGINWDDELTADMYEKWKIWFECLKSIEELKIPRCYSSVLSTSTTVQLHVFCDASEKAFSAVAYFRMKKNGVFSTAFVVAKCRVAALKPMSIPRLELQAALLGSRIAVTIREEHDIKISKTVYWSDSKTVLCWLRSDARRFKQFVANRVGEIEELTDLSDWRWIPTKENVADEGTKWTRKQEVKEDSRWFTGPQFLLLEEAEWPQESEKRFENGVEEELKPEFVAVINNQSHVLLELPEVARFSKWLRLVRATAWSLRFVNNCLTILKKRDATKTGELTPQEFQAAEKILIKRSQWDSYSTELKLLSDGKRVDNASRLFQLSPSLDTEGILRIRGRLEMATGVNEDVKRPVILDPKNSLTRLLIQHLHVSNGHLGQENVINEIRQRYWIPNIRNAVKGVWRSCLVCKNAKTLPIPPEMGQLPRCRVNGRVPPFTCTGMDYFGPMLVTIGRRNEKRYGVLFTCMATRAVHLEIAASLTTDSCIMAIRRMIARRGCPKEIYSDNGKNFRGADTELKTALEQLDQDNIVKYLTPKGISWHFIPPLSPHMGGSWERLVKSVKTALKATLKERAPREEVLTTLLLEAEQIVNSRPLTYISSDPNDPETLTPNHFLLGKSSAVQAPGVFNGQETNLRKQWRISQSLADMFWRRWVKEYLPTLVKRTKWHRETRPVAIGDLVFIVDQSLPRNSWPKGRVTKTYPGKDGTVRVVDVKTVQGLYKRPVTKIAVLHVDPAVEERQN